MYLVKNLLTILVLFYAYSAVSLPCDKVFKSKSAFKESKLNGDTLKKDTETIEQMQNAVNREWDRIWASFFPKDYLIAIDDLPQLTKKEQIDMMFGIVEIPEYSFFDVRERRKWLKVLFVNGVDVNTQNASGDSSLHIAARMRGISGRSLVRFLLSNGAKVHLENQLGRTPLDVAYAYSNQEIAEILQKEMQ